MPSNWTLAQLLDYERLSREAKLIYVLLNTQTPCPPRGAVPVYQAWLGSCSLSPRGSPSVMDATAPAMSKFCLRQSDVLVNGAVVEARAQGHDAESVSGGLA